MLEKVGCQVLEKDRKCWKKHENTTFVIYAFSTIRPQMPLECVLSHFAFQMSYLSFVLLNSLIGAFLKQKNRADD